MRRHLQPSHCLLQNLKVEYLQNNADDLNSPRFLRAWWDR